MNIPTEVEPIIVAAITEWLEDTTTLFTGDKDPQGNKLTGPVNVYAGFLPINMSGAVNTSLPRFFPHVIVQCSEGRYTFEEGTMNVKLMVGAWDDNEDMSGYKGVQRICEKLILKMYHERIIGDKLPLTGVGTWKLLQGAELWPQFFGLMDFELEAFLPSSRFDGQINNSIGWDDRMRFAPPGAATPTIPAETGS